MNHFSKVDGGCRFPSPVLEPARLISYDLTVDDVPRARVETDTNVSARVVGEGGQEYLVHGDAFLQADFIERRCRRTRDCAKPPGPSTR